MSPDERLAAIFAALTRSGIPSLVLGGHAVRYYGIDRNTIDYDLHVALGPSEWSGLPGRLGGPELFPGLREGPSWRPADFRRFAIGTLPDGRDEWLECWRRNHLLAPFPELQARREEGNYGGGRVSFLGLPDLIRSKETERASDWHDLALLEEVADLRNIGRARHLEERAEALASVRSRRGFEDAGRRGWLQDRDVLRVARRRAEHPLSLAYLCPGSADTEPGMSGRRTHPAIAELLEGPLRSVAPGSARHLALVEAVRRHYKRAAMEADRLDKESVPRP